MARHTLPMAVLVCGLAAITLGSASTADFRLEVQLSDGGIGTNAGTLQATPWAMDGGGDSRWASDGDGNPVDPDAVRIALGTRDGTLEGKDFRLLVRLKDQGITGDDWWAATPWASDGGGWSDWAYDKRDGGTFDEVQVRLETRDAPGGWRPAPFRVGYQLNDHSKNPSEHGVPRYTPVMGQDGDSPWASDESGHDPDGIRICLDPVVVQLPDRSISLFQLIDGLAEQLRAEAEKQVKARLEQEKPDLKTTGFVKFLGARQEKGAKLSTIVLDFHVNARLVDDRVNVKVGAVTTNQLVRIRIERSPAGVKVTGEVVEATSEKERQAKQADADELRGRVKAEIQSLLSRYSKEWGFNELMRLLGLS